MKREDIEREADSYLLGFAVAIDFPLTKEGVRDCIFKYLKEIYKDGILRGIDIGFEAARESNDPPIDQNYLWDYRADSAVLDKYETAQDFIDSLLLLSAADKKD